MPRFTGLLPADMPHYRQGRRRGRRAYSAHVGDMRARTRHGSELDAGVSRHRARWREAADILPRERPRHDRHFASADVPHMPPRALNTDWPATRAGDFAAAGGGVLLARWRKIIFRSPCRLPYKTLGRRSHHFTA